MSHHGDSTTHGPLSGASEEEAADRGASTPSLTEDGVDPDATAEGMNPNDTRDEGATGADVDPDADPEELNPRG